MERRYLMTHRSLHVLVDPESCSIERNKVGGCGIIDGFTLRVIALEPWLIEGKDARFKQGYYEMVLCDVLIRIP